MYYCLHNHCRECSMKHDMHAGWKQFIQGFSLTRVCIKNGTTTIGYVTILCYIKHIVLISMSKKCLGTYQFTRTNRITSKEILTYCFTHCEHFSYAVTNSLVYVTLTHVKMEASVRRGVLMSIYAAVLAVGLVRTVPRS